MWIIFGLPGRGRPFPPTLSGNWWSASRFQDDFDARPQPPGLSGTGAFTAVLPKKLEKVTCDFRLLLVLILRPRIENAVGFEDDGRGTKGEDESTIVPIANPSVS